MHVKDISKNRLAQGQESRIERLLHDIKYVKLKKEKKITKKEGKIELYSYSDFVHAHVNGDRNSNCNDSCNQGHDESNNNDERNNNEKNNYYSQMITIGTIRG